MRLPAVIRFLALFAPAVLLCCPAFAGEEPDGAQGNPGLDFRREGQNPPQVQSSTEQKDPELLKIDLLVINPGKDLPGIENAGSRPITEIINPFTSRKRSRIYGSLYEYHRNDNFDARNFFDPVGQKLPEYKRNQFGGTVGVLLSDRLTLFASYDGLRINQGSTILSHVPTTEMKKGDFSSVQDQLVNPWTGANFQGNQIPENLFSPPAVKMLETIPDPNRNDPVRNFVNNLPEVQNQDTIEGRVDYELGENSKIFANYTLSNGNGVEVEPLPVFGLNSRGREQRISIDFVREFGSQLVLSISAGYDREADTELAAQAGQTGLLASLGIAGVSTLDDLDEGYPDFDISGYAGLGSGHSPSTSFVNAYDLDFELGYVRRNHSLEFGARIEAGQINNDRTGGVRRGGFEMDGSFSGDAFADFLLGLPTAAERGVGSDRADLRRKEWGFSFRDDWKVNRKLSLSFGLSWDYTPFAHSIHDNVYTFVPLLFEPPPDGKIVLVGSEEANSLGLAGLKSGHAVFPDRDDWEPSVGFAFSPLGNNRLIIRASYQMWHHSLDMDESFEVLGRSYPAYYTEKAEAPEGEPILTLSNPFEGAVPTELTIQGAEPRMRNANSYEWELSIENEIIPQWNVEFTYSGSRTTGSDRFIVANVPVPGPGSIQERRPNPDFGRFSILTAGGSSSSNSLRATLRKRLSLGFSVDASYEYGRTFSSIGSSDPSNPRDLRSERAPSSNPVHEFDLSFIYDLPIGRGRAFSTEWAGALRRLIEGWRISGIASFRTGELFHPRLPGDFNNDGVRGDRPDRLGPGKVPESERSIDRWFATEDFVYPAQYGFGNSGRDILVGPGSRNWDISFIKRTQVSRDGDIFELRVHLFNAFNHTNFDNPNTTVGTSSFGKIFGAARSREIEIAVKYLF